MTAVNGRPVVVVGDPAAPAEAAIALATWEAARRETDVRVVPADEVAALDAAMVVVSGWSPSVDELVATTWCALAVVPAGVAPCTADAPVLLDAGVATEREVFAFAFAEAAARGSGVLAVRTWDDEQGRLALTHRLCPFITTYPQVRVESTISDAGRADLLAALSHEARMLVTGRPTRDTPLPAPANLACPVVIVPPPRPVHYSWLSGQPCR